MSRTNVKLNSDASKGGFTLLEVVVAVALSAIIFAGVLGGFTFLGRNLARLMNSQEQESKSRRAFHLLGQDISGAKKIELIESTSAVEKLRLVVQGAAASPYTVQYTYDRTASTLSRTAPATTAPYLATTSVLLTNLNLLNFKYYNQAGMLLTLALSENDPIDLKKSGLESIKEIEMSFSSALGNQSSGAQVSFAGKSPRFVLRNRDILR